MAIRFLAELNVYQSLKDQTSGCFAEFLGAGDLICSSALPAGYVLLLEKVPGVICSDEMLENSRLRTLLETRLRSAILALRNAGFVHGDPVKSNVMVDAAGARVALLDFEHAVPNVYGIGAEDYSEVSEIMAPPFRM